MRIALAGASGFIGSKILEEALSRGHSVTALCRHPEKIAVHEGVQAIEADATDAAALTEVVRGHDVLVHAAAPPREMEMGPKIAAQTAITTAIIAAAKAAGVPRIAAVGGAGTLRIDGVRHLDRPDFPPQFIGGATATAVVKELLHHQHDVAWTVLSPSTMIFPGERTGSFRLGLDDLLRMPDGSGKISVEDYAVAFVDELESPRHTGRRFTVGY